MDVEKSHKANGVDGIGNGHAEDTNGDGKISPTGPDHRSEFGAKIAAMSPEEYAEAEKKLLRKMDLNIIPWIT